MKFKNEEARAMTWGEMPEGVTRVSDEIVDHRRWSVDHFLVIEKDGKFYAHGYSVGATESQDETPFEYDGDEVEFFEVERKEKTIFVYEKVV